MQTIAEDFIAVPPTGVPEQPAAVNSPSSAPTSGEVPAPVYPVDP
jgi:hypothetical protein